MEFTREPIIETIVTPKEGCKLVVRSSKSGGQEEFFVEAVEVVSFGSSFFFRSLERPKAFLVPASDYEILEVREARMILKNVGADRSAIKIGGGREAPMRPAAPFLPPKEPREREEGGRRPSLKNGEAAPEAGQVKEKASFDPPTAPETPAAMPSSVIEGRGEKKRDRRRHYRRRRGSRDDSAPPEGDEWLKEGAEDGELINSGREEGPGHFEGTEGDEFPESAAPVVLPQPPISSIIPPPAKLISESIAHYRDKPYFRRPPSEEIGREAPLQVVPIPPKGSDLFTPSEISPGAAPPFEESHSRYKKGEKALYFVEDEIATDIDFPTQ